MLGPLGSATEEHSTYGEAADVSVMAEMDRIRIAQLPTLIQNQSTNKHPNLLNE